MQILLDLKGNLVYVHCNYSIYSYCTKLIVPISILCFRFLHTLQYEVFKITSIQYFSSIFKANVYNSLFLGSTPQNPRAINAKTNVHFFL